MGSGTKRAALGVVVFLGFIHVALAQSPPPVDLPRPSPLTKDPEAIAWEGWLLYPELGVKGVWSNNLYQSSVNPIDAAGYALDPRLVAKWTNGIHSTTLYGSWERRLYPSDDRLNTSDRNAGVIQRYEPLRDLKISVQGDYQHFTNTSVLINGLPSQPSDPGAPPPPAPPLNVVSNTLFINPANTFTGTVAVEKLLNRGIVTLSGSIARTEYEETPFRDFTVRNFNASGAHWLGPVFYAYFDSALAYYTDSNVHRVLGGLGTRQFGLVSVSGYFGHQGTDVQETDTNFGSAGTAGGEIYGGKLSYFPSPDLTVSLAVDRTINISSIRGSDLAVNQQLPSPLAIPVGNSTKITATSLQIAKIISDRWSIYPRFGMTHVDYVDSPRYSDAWLADVVLKHKFNRRLTLSWEYQFTSINSNIPLTASYRHYLEASAVYKF